jgi:hypothetical protein
MYLLKGCIICLKLRSPILDLITLLLLLYAVSYFLYEMFEYKLRIFFKIHLNKNTNNIKLNLCQLEI